MEIPKYVSSIVLHDTLKLEQFITAYIEFLPFLKVLCFLLYFATGADTFSKLGSLLC